MGAEVRVEGALVNIAAEVTRHAGNLRQATGHKNLTDKVVTRGRNTVSPAGLEVPPTRAQVV